MTAPPSVAGGPMPVSFRNRYYQVLREPALLIGTIVIFLLLGLFILYPLFSAARLSLMSEGRLSGEVYGQVFSTPRYLRSIRNSVLLGAIVATTSTLLGFVFAYAITRARIPGRGFFRAMAVLPIISPPFMFALSVILLFGRNGLITAKLLGLDMASVYGLKGLVIVQTIGMFPIAYMTLSGILQGIDPDLESCAMNLGARRRRVFRTVTLPLALPALLASWLLVFVSSMTDFGNPIILGGDFDVMSVQAYLEFTGMGNLPRGTVLAILLLVPTAAVFFVQKALLRNRGYTTITGKATRREIAGPPRGVRVCLALICAVASGFILLFYATIVSGSFIKLWGIDWSFTLEHFSYSFDVGLKTLRNTLVLAVISTPITAFLGMAISFLVVRRRFPGRHLMEGLSLMSYAIPGTAVGIGYVLAFNKAPFELSGTAFILIACYVFRNVPIGVEGGIAALRQISKDIEESSVNLGATSAVTFRRITLPLIRPAFFAGATFAFVRSMTAISAIIFLVSARWNHLTVLILAQTEILRLGAASVMSTVLIVIIMAGIFIIMKLTGLGREQIFGTAKRL